VRERKNHQKIIQNEVEIHVEINETINAKSMLEKVMQKTLKIFKNGAQKGANSHHKSINN
jgi:hypothetical protein